MCESAIGRNAEFNMSGNNMDHDVYARVPRWMWGVLVGAIAWATHVTIQLAALNIRVEQAANVSDQVEANVKIVSELLITIRERMRLKSGGRRLKFTVFACV